MTYNGNFLSRVVTTIEGLQGEYIYQTTDSVTAFTAAGYISDAGIRGLKLGDTVWAINTTTGVSVQCFVGAINGTGVNATATLVSNAPPSFGANFRNVLDGGDFTVNPFQRNVPGIQASAGVSAAATNTAAYFADRWFTVSGSSAGSVVQAIAADTAIPGFSQALQVYRTAANTNTALISLGQVVETADVIKLQGQAVTFSFYAKSLATFSALGGVVNVQIVTGTGTASNQTVANLLAGSWTGQANTLNTTQALTSAYSRYQFTATLPANTTQLAVIISWNPVGTASGSTDGIQVQGLQLELGSVASLFEHRDVQVELEICQRYAWVTAEPAANVVVGSGMNTTTAIQVFYMATPVQLRVAPTVTVGAGTFKTNQASTATATTITAGTTHTPNAISINGNSTGTAGQATLLQGGGGSGWILASADF